MTRGFIWRVDIVVTVIIVIAFYAILVSLEDYNQKHDCTANGPAKEYRKPEHLADVICMLAGGRKASCDLNLKTARRQLENVTDINKCDTTHGPNAGALNAESPQRINKNKNEM